MAAKSAKEKKWQKGVRISFQLVFGILLHIFIILGTIYITRNVYAFSYQIFGNDTVAEEPGTDVMITIRRGDTTKQIAELLEHKHVIKNSDSFFIRAKFMVNASAPILPGVYKLNTSMNYGNIIRTITDPGADLREES
ncbi:endolytic transglycosylase MltG [[Clostridium] polysaccharolyticum]|uniref:YceG-like family protein n=1 Tax=[Clostridium] polysaccharolyticum TaxID=29364 RepID=A0A1H9ZQY6_9FIRM|nr:endolytic transglycosylase MltG [[Clostridium] polysaccharolyticum]SES84020.1 YceG-like family protein [[Clostridium] polysaccharolyticum]